MAVLAMGPPAIAMGTTLPLVTRAVVTDMSSFAWRTGLLYALNTFGAMAGAFAAGFYLPIWLGMHGSIYLAAGINVRLVSWRGICRRDPARLETAAVIPRSHELTRPACHHATSAGCLRRIAAGRSVWLRQPGAWRSSISAFELPARKVRFTASR